MCPCDRGLVLSPLHQGPKKSRKRRQEEKTTGSGTGQKQQDILASLQTYPELLNLVPSEYTLTLAHSDEPETQLAFINSNLPHLVPKLSSSDAQGLHQQFRESYASQMNAIAEKIKECISLQSKRTWASASAPAGTAPATHPLKER